MKIRKVTLRHYRVHRALEVTFDDQRTLIAGPNEAGKSTLVEAVHRALFVRHKSTTDLQRIRSRSVSAWPEVGLEFHAGEHEWTLRKVFKGAQGSIASLINDTTGERWDGDAAEEKLRELLDVEDLGPQRSKQQWAHLWVWQGTARDNPTSSDVIGHAAVALRRRLGDLSGAGGTLETAADRAVHSEIVKAHQETFGERGVKKNSPLGIADAELNTARGAASAAAALVDKIGGLADSILDDDQLIEQDRASLVRAQEELAEVNGALGQIQAIEQSLDRLEGVAKNAAKEHKDLETAHETIAGIDREIADRTKAIEPRECELTGAKATEARLRVELGRIASDVTAAQDAHQVSQATWEHLQASVRLFELRSTADRLRDQRAKIEEQESRADAIDEQIRALPAIDAATAKEIEDLDRQLTASRGRLEAIATRIEVVRADQAVAIDGRPVSAGEAETLVEPADLTVGEGTTIRILPGGGQSLADLRLEIADRQTSLDGLLSRVGVPDVAAARLAFQTRQTLESQSREKRAEIRAARPDGIREELAKVTETLSSLEADVERWVSAGFEAPVDAAAAARAMAEADSARQKAAERLSDVRGREAEKRREAQEAATRRESLAEALAEDRGAIADRTGRKSALESVHGVGREARLAKLADAAEAAGRALADSQKALADLRPGDVRADQSRLQRVITEATKRIDAAVVRQSENRGALRENNAKDPHGVKTAADARHDIAIRRRAETARQAEAVKLLRGLFDERLAAVTTQFAKPLCERVAAYLDVLFGSGSRVTMTVGDSIDDFTVARVAQGRMAFGFDDLSEGTREQVAMAFRLAMAEILARGRSDGCLPLVLDDAFANTDPERIKAVHRMLDVAAQRGLQVIVVSCCPADYDLLGARRIDLRRAAPESIGVPSGDPLTDAEAVGDDGDSEGGDERTAEAEGSVPEGSDDELAARFLETLGGMVEKRSGNKRLRESLGWDEGTYTRIKSRLIESGAIKTGKGKGGSVILVE